MLWISYMLLVDIICMFTKHIFEFDTIKTLGPLKNKKSKPKIDNNNVLVLKAVVLEKQQSY